MTRINNLSWRPLLVFGMLGTLVAGLLLLYLDRWSAIACIPLLLGGLAFRRGYVLGAFLLGASAVGVILGAGCGVLHWSTTIVAAASLLSVALVVPVLWRFDSLATGLLCVAMLGLGAGAANTLLPSASESSPPAVQAADTTASPESPARGWVVAMPYHLSLSDFSCWVDEPFTKGESGELTVDGSAAVLVFGQARFQGSVKGSRIETTYQTRFHFEDGCDWQSTQRITGNPSQGALQYHYSEEPLPGQTGCASSCTAETSLSLIPN
jgi:hypothetical protein